MAQPRLLITGVSGLLGLNAACQVRDRFEVVGCYHHHAVQIPGVECLRLDATDPEALRLLVGRVRPAVILHTVALADVDGCEVDPDLAWRLNTQAAQTVAQAAREVGARLIHLSTDQLFSGTQAMVPESAVPHPRNVYGFTKLEAEQRVLEACPAALVIRTNFFGWGPAWRASLSDWILRSLQAGKTLSMFTDVYFTPLLVNDLVEAALRLSASGVAGILNVGGRERLSKFEFGVRLAQAFDLSPAQIRPTSVEAFPFKAPRPHDMSLDSEQAARALGHPLPDVAESIYRLRGLKADGWAEALAVAGFAVAG